MDSLKRRRAFLLRLMMGLHLLTKSLSAQLGGVRPGAADDPQVRLTVQRAIQRSLAEVTRELGELKLEGNCPEELEREWEGLVTLHANSSGAGADESLSRAILRFHESRKAWQEEVMGLEEKIEALTRQLAGDENRKILIQRAQAAGTSQPVLLQLVKAARQRGADDPVVRRLETPFVRRMLGLLKKRNEWVTRYGGEAAEREAELALLHKKLREGYRLDVSTQKSDPRVEGRFGMGVRLHAEEQQSPGGREVNGAMLIAADSGDAQAVYGMQDGTIVRLAN